MSTTEPASPRPAPPPRRVYVDFDDVLCETARALLDIMAREFGRHYRFEDIQSFNLDETFALSPDAYDRFMARVHDPAVLGAMRPLPHVVDVLGKWIRAGAGIAVVTGRPADTEVVCRDWLQRHGLGNAELVFVDKYGRPEAAPPGARVYRPDDVADMGFDLAVEDAPAMIRHLVERTSVPVAVLDRPWNRALRVTAAQRKRFRRCRDWREIDAVYSPFICTPETVLPSSEKIENSSYM